MRLVFAQLIFLLATVGKQNSINFWIKIRVVGRFEEYFGVDKGGRPSKNGNIWITYTPTTLARRGGGGGGGGGGGKRGTCPLANK